ncbi:MAG: hypothetical protein GY940_37495 [bacterium]|nr:hypothetical protein [bacterium]
MYDYRYQAFGLTFGSTMEIPELLPADDPHNGNANETGEPDVLIQQGTVPLVMENPRKTGVRFQAKENQFLLIVDDVARYHVSNGNRIHIDTHDSPGVRDSEVRLFLLGSAFGALFHQRGMLPLHAGAVKAGDRCVLFCGNSGSGKSTTAKALMERGYPLLTDDICVISMEHPQYPGVPVAFPGYPQLKLWEDALEKMGNDFSGYHRVRRLIDKYAVPTPGSFIHYPQPIKQIYFLSPWEKEQIEISPVTGMKKFNALKRHTYRFQLLEGLGKGGHHFQSTAMVGRHVSTSRVRRPKDLFLLDQLIDALETDFTGENTTHPTQTTHTARPE